MRTTDMSDINFRNELKNFIRQNMLIPFIGSGFTRSEKTKNGLNVVSGEDMEKYMIDKLLHDKPDFATLEQYNNLDFSELSDIYDAEIPLNERKEYLKKYFFNVQLSQTKKEFINQKWNFIYTLNTDDAIENNNDNIEQFLPNKDIDENFIKFIYEENKIPLFKIHGDVRHYLKYGKDLIFSKKNYLSSLKTNNFLLSKIASDIQSNCLMFIGCSLNYEIDILHGLLTNSIEKDTSLSHTYYVTNNKNLSGIDLHNLKKYHVDTIIQVDDYQQFYQEIISLFNETLVDEQKEDILENKIFENPIVSYDESNNAKTMYNDFLYLTNSAHPFRSFPDKKIILPSFFIKRTIKDDDKILPIKLPKQTITILYGHRFCGKTFALLDLYRNCIDRNRIFIPENILIESNNLESLILNSNNISIFIDINYIDDNFSKFISKNLTFMKEKNIQIVLTLTSAKKANMFILNQLAKDLNNNKREEYIKLIYIPNVFSKKEITNINKSLQNTLVGSFQHSKNFKSRITLLDNIYESLISSSISQLPKNDLSLAFTNIKSKDISSDLIQLFLIILIQNGRISSKDIQLFYLNEISATVLTEYNHIFQYDYMNINEKGFTESSSLKLICNSKYWVIKQLQFISSDKSNYAEIAKAYVDIVSSINNYYLQDKNKARNQVSKYIKFDEINDTFAVKDFGSRLLIETIYDNLFDQLKDNFQYLHQRAKSLSWQPKNISSLKKGLAFVDKSQHEIKNLYQKEYKLKDEYFHVCYTRAIICTRIANFYKNNDPSQNDLAIVAIYEALYNCSDNMNYIEEDNRQGRPNEILKFIKYLIHNSNVYSEKNKSKVNYLYQNVIKTMSVDFNKRAFRKRAEMHRKRANK